MIEFKDILENTNGGKDIFLFFRPEWATYFNDLKKKFSYRGDDKTASAHFFMTKNGMWIIKDFGGDDVRPYDFYVQEKGLLYTPYPIVLQRMAADFGVEDKLDVKINAPRIEWREQKPGEADIIYEFDNSISDENLRVLGPAVKAEDAANLH